MKKIFALFLALLLIFSMTSCREEQQPAEEKHIEISETENYIRLPDGVSEEMLSADFWINLKPSEKVLMAPKGISEKNVVRGFPGKPQSFGKNLNGSGGNFRIQFAQR